jgi:hypothetical protein
VLPRNDKDEPKNLGLAVSARGDRTLVVDQLKKELMQLLELQHIALIRTPYLDLTPEEEREIESRNMQIRILIEQLQNENDPHET